MGAARRNHTSAVGLARSVSTLVGLSSASCFPETLADTFAIAKELGYDGVEVMVSTESATQDAGAIMRLSEHYELPVLSVHAPCLLITQRVWGLEPWNKVVKSVELAQRLGSPIVVLHPPFRWQRKYAKNFAEKINFLSQESGVDIAIENMFPWSAKNRELTGYLPDYSVVNIGYDNVTLDLSHTATSGEDPFVIIERENVVHLHLADGVGLPKDEHLAPGRGTQPCAEVLHRLKSSTSLKSVVLEVSTRRVATGKERREILGESLAFARRNLE